VVKTKVAFAKISRRARRAATGGSRRRPCRRSMPGRRAGPCTRLPDAGGERSSTWRSETIVTRTFQAKGEGRAVGSSGRPRPRIFRLQGTVRRHAGRLADPCSTGAPPKKLALARHQLGDLYAVARHRSCQARETDLYALLALRRVSKFFYFRPRRPCLASSVLAVKYEEWSRQTAKIVTTETAGLLPSSASKSG